MIVESGRMLLRGGTVAGLDPLHVEATDLRIEGERIVERGRAVTGDAEEIDLSGCVVLPGFVNAHTHLYSALARGMPWPSPPPRNFVEVLEKVWWKLDRALDEEAVYQSAIVGAIDAALSGTTLLVDHHSSPSFIRGSLATVCRAVEEVGLRSVLCYEVTDRNGPGGRDEGIAENEAFLATAPSPLTRGMVGAHASFTLSDEALGRLAGLCAASGESLHIHVAEDRADAEDCAARYGIPLLERFDRHHLLVARTLFAHCVHLSPDEIHAAHTKGAWIAHNPRSNMNNAVGYAATAAMKRAALGTDGIDGDMFAEARAAHLQMREAGRGDAMDATLQLLAGGHRLGAAVFGLPFGKLDAGGPADLVVLDYRPPTPLTTASLGGHLLFGIDRSHVRSVMVAGRWVVRDRALVNLDARAVAERAQAVAARLWARMARI
jgi:putative selenium metabolism protein SsnA